MYMRGETSGEARAVGSRTGRFLAAASVARSCWWRMRAKSVAFACTRSLCRCSEAVGRAVRPPPRGDSPLLGRTPLLLLLRLLLLLLKSDCHTPDQMEGRPSLTGVRLAYTSRDVGVDALAHASKAVRASVAP